jgi:adenylate cyclase
MTYRFGDFELWRERYELRRGAAPVALEPRVFEVLAYLVHHRDRVVPKSELLASLWPGQYVTDSALTRTIGEARRALRHEKWIKTVYGRGFAFTAPVVEVAAGRTEAESAPPARPALPSVAVLPFADLSAARDQGHFCDGLADELIGALTGIEGLSVGSRTASFQFRDTGADVRAIAERLNVAAVLEGSVRKEGRRLRISVQLINAADNYHLWAAVFDRRVDDAFAIQAEVAAETVRALRVVLTDRETLALRSTLRAEASAYDYTYGRFCAVAGRDALAAARLACAESLSPGDCHYPLLAAMIHARQGRADEAKAARRRGIERAERQVGSDPDNARPLYLGAGALVALGEPERGMEWAERALTLDPDDSMALFYAGDAYASAGRVPRALECLDRALRSGFHHLAWIDVVAGLASLRRDPRLRQLLRAAGRSRA